MIMKKGSGFTLIEMMVVLAVASVLLGIGLPRLSVFFQNSRMTTNTNALVGAFQIAKSEAIKRQVPITLCRSGDQVNCDRDAANTWEDGFIVFYDANGNWIYDGDTSSDILLRINEGAEGEDVTIRSDALVGNQQNEHQYVIFTSRGHPKNGTALQTSTYVICDDRGLGTVTVDGVPKTAARGVVLSMSGKVRSTRDGTKLTTCTP